MMSNYTGNYIHLEFNIKKLKSLLNPNIQTYFVEGDDGEYLYLKNVPITGDTLFPLPKKFIKGGYVRIQIIKKKIGGRRKKTRKYKGKRKKKTRKYKGKRKKKTRKYKGKRKKKTRKRRGGEWDDDKGDYIVFYNTPELKKHAMESGIQQHYLFNLNHNGIVTPVWLTWGQYETIQRKINTELAEKEDARSAAEMPQMMNTIFSEKEEMEHAIFDIFKSEKKEDGEKAYFIDKNGFPRNRVSFKVGGKRRKRKTRKKTNN